MTERPRSPITEGDYARPRLRSVSFGFIEMGDGTVVSDGGRMSPYPVSEVLVARPQEESPGLYPLREFAGTEQPPTQLEQQGEQ